MLRQHGDGKISGVTDSGRFAEFENSFIFRSRDIDGVYLNVSNRDEDKTKSTTVFFKGHMCAIPDNEEKLYKFLRDILIDKVPAGRECFRNNPEIKP